ncbi:MAG: UDP-N-acetylmuramate dehydrogenase [Myxococcota bacterium]
MTANTDVSAALTAAGVEHRTDEPLVKKTWWRVGGPADVFVDATDEPTLRRVLAVARDHGAPVFVLGNASNLLVSDRGVRGIVVRLGGGLAEATEEPGAGAPNERVVRLGAGAKLVPLCKRAERAGWSGLERFAGIPGTVGGAVRMNAGTALGEVSDLLLDVDVILPDGTRERLPRESLAMGYRHAELPDGAVVVAARLKLTDEDPAAAWHKAAEHLEYRARTQPVDVPTCGSTFRNPPGDRAGRLIEACGLKGLTIGGAQVSPKHANFLVNTGEATAADIRTLIERIRTEVRGQTGIELVPEVHLAGEW